MATRNPVVYQDDLHTPLNDGDTLPVEAIPVSTAPDNAIEVTEGGLAVRVPTPDDIAAVFTDCSGEAHVAGASVPTCEQMTDAIDEALPTPAQIAAVFRDCDNAAHVAGASVPTCGQMTAAIDAALPTPAQIAAVFKDCANAAHVAGASVPTCEQMTDAIAAALAELGISFADNGTVGVTGDGSVENPFKLDVKISGEEGNRLEVRNGQLGVFDTAPPDLANLYLSYVSGDDTNPGTRAAPLKTLAEALRRIASGSSGRGEFNLYFKSGETHVVGQDLSVTRNARIRLLYYDDPIFGDALASCPGSYPELAASLTRPALDFHTFNSSELGGTLWPTLRCNDLDARGVNILTPTAPPTATGGPAGFILEVFATAILSGCDVSVRAGRFIRPKSVVIQLVQMGINQDNGARFADMAYQPAFDVWDAYVPGSYVEQCPGGPVIDYRSGNARSVLTPALIGGGYDATTKTMFGYNTTWDIFA